MRWLEDYRSHVDFETSKPHKATLFRSDHLLIGLNCLEPGQSQAVHHHAGEDKFYLVLEGTGRFTVGEDRREAGPGHVVWAPAGVDHGVENDGPDRLVVLIGMAPSPGG